MSVISITGFGDQKLLDQFIKDWNESEKTTQKKKDIYIDSPGGFVSIFQVIQNMIDSCLDKCSLTAVGELHSSAFELFYSVKCKRKILPFTFGMYHLSYDDITIDEKGKAKEEYGKARLDNLKLTKQHTISFCKSVGMNQKEIREITSGRDVYFQQDRLNYFLKVTK